MRCVLVVSAERWYRGLTGPRVPVFRMMVNLLRLGHLVGQYPALVVVPRPSAYSQSPTILENYGIFSDFLGFSEFFCLVVLLLV